MLYSPTKCESLSSCEHPKNAVKDLFLTKKHNKQPLQKNSTNFSNSHIPKNFIFSTFYIIFLCY